MRTTNWPVFPVRSVQGFGLTELMIALAVMMITMSAVVAFFGSFQRITQQQDQVVALQSNLRAASDRMTSTLRRADYGSPRSLLPTWVNWVSGFNSNPMITAGATSTDPDSITIAACTTRPIAIVAANVLSGVGNNTATLTSTVPGQTIAQLFASAQNKHLMRFIAGSLPADGFARVTAISGSTVTFDTDPGTSGNQGFVGRSYFIDTPVCRVDVTTYAVDPTSRTLTIDQHQGRGAEAAFDGITDLQITGSGNGYDFTVSGLSERPDPGTNAFIPRSLTAAITVRNQ